MGTVKVTPQVGAYVDEWVAVQFIPKEGILPIKKLLKGTPWAIFEATIIPVGSYLLVARGPDAWRINDGDWVIKSPHDKAWFMGEAEFTSQFHVWAES